MSCKHCEDAKPPEQMTKDELMREVVDTADLSEMEDTASYGFKKQQFVELVQFLRDTAGKRPSRARSSGERE